MKILIFKLSLLTILSVVMFELFSLYIIADNYRYDLVSSVQGTGGGISRAIVASRQRIEAENVLMGDSVAGRLASHLNLDKNWKVLTSIQGISLAGQYVFIKNIVANPNVENIVLLYHPRSFMNDLNQPQTYLRFIRNFYTTENIRLLTRETIDKINKKQVSVIYRTSLSKVSPLFCLINYEDDRYEDVLNKKSITPYLSDTSIQYLRLIKKVCDSNNVRFKVIMPIISTRDANRLNVMKNQLASYVELKEVFQDYFEHIVFLDDKYFTDAIHYSMLYDSTIKQIANDRLLPLILKNNL